MTYGVCSRAPMMPLKVRSTEMLIDPTRMANTASHHVNPSTTNADTVLQDPAFTRSEIQYNK